MADPLFLQPGEMEVFRAGNYPQGDWPESKVAAAAAKYDPSNEHRAYLGVKHRPKGQPEGRAYGFFESFRAVGGSLIGKLAAKVPQAVKDALASGEVNTWSAELWPEYTFGDGTTGPYIKAVKLLGDVPPAIKGLKAALEFKEEDHGAVETFDISTAPYVASSLADVLKADEVRRELSDIQWAFRDQTERVMCASDLTAAEKRAELNRLATELASLTEGEVAQYEEDEPVADPKKTETPAPNTPAAASTDPVKFAELESQFAELKAQNDALRASNEASNALIEKIGRETLRGKIASFSEQAKKDGKLIAGDVEAGVDAFMEAIEPVFFEVAKTDKDGKAGETEKVSALSWFQEHVGRRVTAVPVGVNSKGAKASVPGSGRIPRSNDQATPESVDFDERVTAYAEEHKIDYMKAYKIVAAEDVRSA